MFLHEVLQASITRIDSAIDLHWCPKPRPGATEGATEFFCSLGQGNKSDFSWIRGRVYSENIIGTLWGW